MKKTFRPLICLLAWSSLALAAPFTNGGFELPTTQTTIFLFNGDPFVTGWTHGGNFQGEFYTFDNQYGILAGEGNYYIGWGASSATGGTLSQTFDTVIGDTYTVDYLLTTQQFLGSNLPFQSNTVAAFDGVTLLNSVVNSFNMAAGNWQAGTQLSFFATSTSTTLIFTDTTTVNNSGPINWGLDAVTVNGQSGAIPEPSTYALMGGSLALLAWLRQRSFISRK
jgi:hypothetical protein